MADLVFGGNNSSADLAFGESESAENQTSINHEDLIFNQPVPANGELVFGQAQNVESAQTANPEDLVFADPIPTHSDLVFGEQDDNTDTQPNQNTITGTLQVLSLQFGGSIINDPNVNRGISTQSTEVWHRGQAINQQSVERYGHALQLQQSTAETWQQAKGRNAQTAERWQRSPRVKTATSEHWEKADRLSQAAVSQWAKSPRVTTQSAAVFEKGVYRAARAQERFTYPPIVRALLTEQWKKGGQLSKAIAEHYSAGRALLTSRKAVWEKAGYPAPGLSVIPTPVDPEIPQLPPAEPIDLIFRERWNPLAYRSLVFGAKAAPINPFSEVYIIMPSATLYRLPDGTEIEATDVSWSSDLDSWGWRFSATLKYPSDMALLKPDNNGMKHIGCTINEHEFIGIVERYSRARSFESGTTFRIEGRSRSAEFSDPFSAKGSGVVAQDLNARQIVESLLQNSGWTLDWQVPDWLVPANSLNWSDADKMSVINKVAQSIGAVVQTHPSHKTLLIKSRYPVSPWHWDDTETTIKTTLPAALIKSDSADFIQRPKYNGAIVAGGPTSGVIIRAKRDGTAGEILPSTVVNPLISDTISGRERARVEISKGGWWESLNAVTWLTNPGEGPALLLPGDLIEIIDIDSNYRAQIGGVSVAVRSTEDALNITQSIQAEKQYGN